MRVLGLVLLLTACGSGPREAAVNETDPAITDALSDPIMADPRLELQHGGGSVAVPLGIDGGDHAQTLGQIAAARVRETAFKGCNAKIDYAFAWMARLPTELAPPDAATVSEAAGSNTKSCNLRVVRYAIAKPVADVEMFYRKSGFALTRGEGTISGIRAKDGTAFWVAVTAAKSGSSVDFVTNRGQ
jgi:hypothetical protein